MSVTPWFPLYVSDWLSSGSVVAMTSAQRGGFIMLLCHAWQQEDCGLPDDDKILSALSGMNGDWKANRKALRGCFEVRGGRLYNARLSAEHAKTKRLQAERSKGGKMRAAQMRANTMSSP